MCQLYLISFFLFLPFLSFAQNNEPAWEWFKLKGGTDAVGRISATDSDSLEILYFDGRKEKVPSRKLKWQKQIEDPSRIVNGQYWREDAGAPIYLYFGSGSSLKKGEVILRYSAPTITGLQVGVTDRWSLNATTEPISALTTGAAPVVILNNRFRISRSREATSQISVGMINFILPDPDFFEDVFSFYVPYLSLRQGTDFRYFTLSAGAFGYKGIFPALPFYQVGAATRLGKKHLLFTDNTVIPVQEIDEFAILFSAGIRFIGKRNSWDLSLIMPYSSVDDSELSTVPYLSASIPLSAKRK